MQMEFNLICYYKTNDCKPIVQSLPMKLASDIEIVLNFYHIPPNKFGYLYWKYAIYFLIKNGQEVLSICNQIYPSVARKYKTTKICVEKSMRICLQQAWVDPQKSKQNVACRHLSEFLQTRKNGEFLEKIAHFVVSSEFQKNKFCV